MQLQLECGSNVRQSRVPSRHTRTPRVRGVALKSLEPVLPLVCAVLLVTHRRALKPVLYVDCIVQVKEFCL